MKKADVHTGERYWANVAGELCVILLGPPRPTGGWDAINTRTGRPIYVRTAQRLRGRVVDDKLEQLKARRWGIR